MMESEAKDGEEENLQSAFKKLRVDAEGSTISLCAADGSTRTTGRSHEDAKPKILGSLKESWHGSSRKTTRGAARTPRRRRSKSPVLHPPKFTHCSAKTSPPSCVLKHKSLPDSQDSGISIGISVTREFGASHSPSTTNVNGYRRFDLEPSGACASETCSENLKEHSSIAVVSEAALKANQSSDFQSTTQLHTEEKCNCKRKVCQCKHWQNMEVYSFSGLRDMLSECEKSVKGEYSQSLQNRTQTTSNSTSGSPRSCSEQARASVDDVTIEDLAGYMEYYLYIPKKMSHMAEMMYT